MECTMTLNEALIILSNDVRDQKRKLEVSIRYGGMLRATDEAMQIARECIKRCRDFEEIRSGTQETK